MVNYYKSIDPKTIYFSEAKSQNLQTYTLLLISNNILKLTSQIAKSLKKFKIY